MTAAEPRTDEHEPSRRWRWGALAVTCVAMTLRSPGLLFSPRLWAEEATIYYVYARHHDLLPSLFLVPSSRGPAGYLSLVPNTAATLASRLVSEELAPLVFTLIALLVQLIPFALVLWGRSLLWRTARERATVCALLLFCSTVIAEVWLNTINSQIFLGLAAALLLVERTDLLSEPGQRVRRWTYRGLLGIAGLNGLYSAFLAPAFALRAWRTGHREAWRQAWIVGVGALVQATAFLATLVLHRPGRDRFVAFDLFETARIVFDHHVLRALLGQRYGGDVATGLETLAGNGAGVLALAALVAGFAALAWRPARQVQWPLLAGYGLLLLLVSPTTNPSPPIHRYAALSGLLLLLNLWCHARHDPRGPRRWVCRALLAVALVAGVGDYHREIPFAALGLEAEGPRWSEEIATWRADPDYMPRLWPFDWARSWRVYLPQAGAQGSFEDPMTLPGPRRLVSTGERAETLFEVPGLPGDFLIVVFFESSQDAERVDFELELRTADGTAISEAPIVDFPQEQRHRAILERRSLRRRGGASFEEVRQVVLGARANGPLPVRVTVEEVHLGPRIQGSFERLLPHLSLPRTLATAPVTSPSPWGSGPTDHLSGLLETVLGSIGPGLLNAVALALLWARLVVGTRTRAPRAPRRRRVLFWGLAIALSVLPGWLSVSASPLVLACALLVVIDRWLDHRSSGPLETLGWGLVLGLALTGTPLLWPLVAVILLDLARDRRRREALTLVGGAVAAFVLDLVLGAPSTATQGGPWIDSVADAARNSGLLFWGREGWAPLYPMAFVAVLCFARSATDRRRTLLFGAMVLCLSQLALLENLGSTGPLGSPELALLYPLFLRLPEPWPPLRRWILAPLTATLLWTLPACQVQWNTVDPTSVPPPREGGLRLLVGDLDTEMNSGVEH